MNARNDPDIEYQRAREAVDLEIRTGFLSYFGGDEKATVPQAKQGYIGDGLSVVPMYCRDLANDAISDTAVERIFDLTEVVDQLLVTRVAAGENTAVSDRIAQHFGVEIALFRYDAEKLVVCAHDETLYIIALLRCDRPRPVEHVLELPAFEHD